MNVDHTYISANKNKALCRKELDSIQHGNFDSSVYKELPEMRFFQILGLTRFWENEELDTTSLVGDILGSCVKSNIPFSYAIIGDGNGIRIYVGTIKLLFEGLETSYKASYPGIDIREVPENPLRESTKSCGGLFTGIPTNKLGSERKNYQIENICRGMLGQNFTYVVFATGIHNNIVGLGHERILQEMEWAFSLINQTVAGGAQGNLQGQKQDFYSKDYFENLESTEHFFKEGVSRGMWQVNGYYASDNIEDARKLGNIIKSAFSGDDSKPDPFRVIEYNSIKDVIANSYMMSELSEQADSHPLGHLIVKDIKVPLCAYRFQTILNSNQLAVLCQPPTKEFPGYYIDEYVEFDVSNRTKDAIEHPIKIGDICAAGRISSGQVDNAYCIEKNDFTRHALIIGITGGGKTNTSKSILNTLWNADNVREKVPFLVIESAKREYWELRNLKGFEDLLVFTLGAEASRTSVKYRINPFETNPGISLQTHIDYLLSTFKAAFDLYPPMPYILEKAVYEVYSDRGWDIVENRNRYGLTEYPTLSDLYNKIDVIVDSLGYHKEVQSNVKAALQARVYSLMIGGKGAMLNTPKSVPISELLSRPVVMELEDLGDDETKSFVIGILLVQLYEYRKSQMSKGAKELSHILMIEEAHRLLKNVPEGGEGGNTRAKSVEFFCNLLAEIRTYGQGIIIADQIPTKIAPDTIKNTNLKIVHRTVALEDREAMGRAMNMTPEQIEYLSSLRRGYAAVYAEGDNKPKCVKLPLVKSFYDKDRDEVIAEVRNKVQNIAAGYDQVIHHHAGCAYCERRCVYYDKVNQHITKKGRIDEINVLLKKLAYQGTEMKAFLDTDYCKELRCDDIFEKICVWGYILQQNHELNDGQRQKYIADFIKCFYS